MLCSSPQDKSSLSQKALAGVVLNPVRHIVRREQGFLVLVTPSLSVWVGHLYSLFGAYVISEV